MVSVLVLESLMARIAARSATLLAKFCKAMLITCAVTTTSALAQTPERMIQQQILRYQELGAQYDDYARSIGFDGHLGTMYIGYWYGQHLCGVLGELVGASEQSQHLYNVAIPPMESLGSGHEAALIDNSLGNWVSAAEHALELEPVARINTWNLDCLGMFEIPRTAAIRSPSPNAEIEVTTPPHGAYSLGELALVVYGDIDSGIYDRFVEAIDANPEVTIISLGSAGGSVLDALLIGSEIRRRGLSTRIHGNCYSACPLVFFGGEHRSMFRSVYRLGFHQIHVDGTPIPFDDRSYDIVSQYLQNMGVDWNIVVNWMLTASPYEMHIPEVSEWCEARVATWIQGLGLC